MHILGRIKELESFPRLAHGIGAVDERRIKSELARGKAVSSEFPLLSREGRGIAHPAARQAEFLAVHHFPLLRGKSQIRVRRADKAHVRLVGRHIERHAHRHRAARRYRRTMV